jgi:hypothetical protein
VLALKIANNGENEVTHGFQGTLALFDELAVVLGPKDRFIFFLFVSTIVETR